MDNPSITLNEFFFKMQNYSVDPFSHDYSIWELVFMVT
jgi:hypothetical protein